MAKIQLNLGNLDPVANDKGKWGLVAEDGVGIPVIFPGSHQLADIGYKVVDILVGGIP